MTPEFAAMWHKLRGQSRRTASGDRRADRAAWFSDEFKAANPVLQNVHNMIRGTTTLSYPASPPPFTLDIEDKLPQIKARRCT
jgi:hypothetical protein